MEEIKKLEDMPKYVPIILIKDNGEKDSESRIFGNNPHDNLVVNYDRSNLYYYNSQCGDGSLFCKEDASCIDDEFYSSWCQMVDLEKLIAEHDKKVKKEVVQEINAELYNKMVLYNKKLEYSEIALILNQLQGENNGIR